MSENQTRPASSERLMLQAPAKINVVLRITGKRADGYHELASLFVKVRLFDDLIFEKTTNTNAVQLTCSDPHLPVDETNLIVRAAVALQQATSTPMGAQIHLQKQIPMQAGLGGGSSDAATTLLGLNELWDLRLSGTQLRKIGEHLGSDVPFFLESATAAWCTGRGECIEAWEPGPRYWFVLVCPQFGLATPAVYRELNWCDSTVVHATNCEEIQAAWQSGTPERLAAVLKNDLEPPAFRLAPLLSEWKRRLEDAGPLGVLMSGSGSSLFALAKDERDAQHIAAAIVRASPQDASTSSNGLDGARVLVLSSQ